MKRLAVCAVVAVVVSGCALLQPGTKVTDGDAKFDLPEYHGLKHAIGCKDFENQAGWHGEWELGQNLSIMLESALYDTGRFVMVEREKLGTVLAEQDLVTSGRAAKAKQVARTGLVRPMRYMATGALTEVREGTSGLGGGVSIRGITLGGGRSTATLTIIAKLVDTTTGEIKAKKRITGQAGRVGFMVGISRGSGSAALGGFGKTPLGEAAQDCINQAALFFAKTMEEFPFEGSVVKVGADGQVIINRGSEFGMQAGKVLTVREEGELLVNPEDGSILGKEEGKVLGKLRVARTMKKMSYCEVVEGEKNPAPGSVVTE